MKTEPNEPINPTIWADSHNPDFVKDNDGLTKREYFASMAMQGLISNAPIGELCNSKEGCIMAIQWADDLINNLDHDKVQQG